MPSRGRYGVALADDGERSFLTGQSAPDEKAHYGRGSASKLRLVERSNESK